jgi:hypothetical protein
MGGKTLPQAMADLAEEYMGHLLGARRVYQGTGQVAADDLQGVGDTLPVAGELHGAGIGQVFFLATDRRFDKPRGEGAQPAHHEESQAEKGQGGAALSAALTTAPHPVRAGAQQKVTDIADEGDALQQGSEANAQAHVAVEDVTELVAYHALQFVALELSHRALGDRDHGVGGGNAGGEGVDAALIGEQVEGRNGHAGGQGQFIHNIQAAPLIRIGALPQDPAPAHTLRDRLAAGGELNPAHQRYQPHRDRDGHTDDTEALPGQELKIGADAAATAGVEVVVLPEPDEGGDQRIDEQNEQQHGRCEQQ